MDDSEEAPCWDSGYKDLRNEVGRDLAGATASSSSRGSDWKGAFGGINSFLSGLARKTQDAVPQNMTERISSIGAATIDRAKSMAAADTSQKNVGSMPHVQAIGNLLRYLTWELSLRFGSEVMDNLEHADAVMRIVTSTSLRQVANALLDVWLNAKNEAFGGCTAWSSIGQSDWLAKVYKVSLGPKHPPSTFSLHDALDTYCSCLAELGLALKGDSIAWTNEERSSWEVRLREARVMVGDSQNSTMNAQSRLPLSAHRVVRLGTGTKAKFSIVPSTTIQKIVDSGLTISEVTAEIAMGGTIAPASLPGIIVPDTIEASGVCVPNEADRTDFNASVSKSVKSLLEKKLYPIILCNRSNQQFRVCLYPGANRILTIPVGGVGGVGTLILDPNKRAFIRLDGEEFWVKAFKPGIIDIPLYTSPTIIRRGQTMSLHTHGCQVD